MIAILILLTTFIAGLVAGYVIRAFISYKRRVQYLQYSAYQHRGLEPANSIERGSSASLRQANRAFR